MPTLRFSDILFPKPASISPIFKDSGQIYTFSYRRRFQQRLYQSIGGSRRFQSYHGFYGNCWNRRSTPSKSLLERLFLCDAGLPALHFPFRPSPPIIPSLFLLLCPATAAYNCFSPSPPEAANPGTSCFPTPPPPADFGLDTTTPPEKLAALYDSIEREFWTGQRKKQEWF
ncbi:hypothetical protein KSP40_PGU004009 [Platanthera guangdongensis]|uniref:Uncharacterized protein n=1 Tax=Platanthera guangdongensis TaxID=2320717 RepID=A0ABR2M9G4_9ASPA